MHVALMNSTITFPIINAFIKAGADLDYISYEKDNLLMIYLKICNKNMVDLDIIRSLVQSKIFLNHSSSDGNALNIAI